MWLQVYIVFTLIFIGTAQKGKVYRYDGLALVDPKRKWLTNTTLKGHPMECLDDCLWHGICRSFDVYVYGVKLICSLYGMERGKMAVNSNCMHFSFLKTVGPFMEIDGGLSDWSPFGQCSITCGVGVEISTRSCNNPSPKHGGKFCQGELKRSRKCVMKACPVDGGLTQWSPFGQCSVTCGDGVEMSTRSCDNPSPKHGGKFCQGELNQSRKCVMKACPVDGGYSSWSAWGKCSATTCHNSGLQESSRQCNNPSPQHGGQPCSEPAVKTQECNIPCPEAKMPSVYVGKHAYRCIDGKYSTNCKCNQVDPWVQVGLEQIMPINNIRLAGYYKMADKFQILVSNDRNFGTSELCVESSDGIRLKYETIIVSCAENIQGKYVRFAPIANGRKLYLELFELEINV